MMISDEQVRCGSGIIHRSKLQTRSLCPSLWGLGWSLGAGIDMELLALLVSKALKYRLPTSLHFPSPERFDAARPPAVLIPASSAL